MGTEMEGNKYKDRIGRPVGEGLTTANNRGRLRMTAILEKEKEEEGSEQSCQNNDRKMLTI